MNSGTLSKNEIRYSIPYANATWIEDNISIGIFASVRMGDQDRIISSDFKEGYTGYDSLTIAIERRESSEELVTPYALYPVHPGVGPTFILSKGVEISIVDSATQEVLWGPKPFVYGINAYHLPEPIEMMYQFSYLAAPYAILSQRSRKIYVIINTIIFEDDEIEGVFTSSEEPFDNFNLAITSSQRGAKKRLCRIFGPYLVENPESVGVKAGSTVNNKPAQKPIGIKSYGDDGYHITV